MKDAANAMDKIPAVAMRKIEGTGLAITLCGITVTCGFGLGNPASLAAPMLILSIGVGDAFFSKDGITSIFLIGGGGGTMGCLCAIGTVGSAGFSIFF